METKSKEVAILRILTRYSNEYNRLTLNEIGQRLQDEYGIILERKAISRCIQRINATEDIISTPSDDHRNGFYIFKNSFENAELKVMLDAISTASFISTKSTQTLTDKLLSQTNQYDSDNLKKHIIYNKKKIETNLFYIIDMLNEAIDNHKLVSFQYLEYEFQGNEAFGRDGAKRYFEPYSLIWCQDHYYVDGFLNQKDPAFNPSSDNLRTFRVDKLRKLTILDESIDKKDYDYLHRSEYSMSMYSGDKVYITLLLNNAGLSLAIDKFGDNKNQVILKKSNNDKYPFVYSFYVEPSPVFFGWLVELGTNGIMIPDKTTQKILDEYKNRLENILKQY